MQENLTLLFANNKGADQPGHMPSLLSAFVIGLQESIPTLTTCKNLKIKASLCK